MTHIDRYDYAFDPQGDAWAARILRRVPAQGTVLELGPGPGAMTRVLRDRGQDVTVVENDPEALEVLRAMGAQCVAANLEDAHWIDALQGRRFDVVLACDVLEHLRQPEDVLRALLDLLAPAGRMVVSVPNIAYAGVLAGLRLGAFDYAEKGQLDRTHMRFFTRRTVETALLDAGWVARSWEANRVPPEASEFAWCWNALAPAQRTSLLDGWTDFDVYQWMVVAGASGDSVVAEMTAARTSAQAARDEMQALRLQHQRELDSLHEHQKAFGEARQIIHAMEQDLAALRAEKAQHEAVIARLGDVLAKQTLAAQWRRWWGMR